MNGRVSKALRKLSSDKAEYKFLKKVYRAKKFVVKKPANTTKGKS